MNKTRTIPIPSIPCCICVRWIHDIYIWSHVTVHMLVLWVLNPTAIMAPFIQVFTGVAVLPVLIISGPWSLVGNSKNNRHNA